MVKLSVEQNFIFMTLFDKSLWHVLTYVLVNRSKSALNAGSGGVLSSEAITQTQV